MKKITLFVHLKSTFLKYLYHSKNKKAGFLTNFSICNYYVFVLFEFTPLLEPTKFVPEENDKP